MVVPPPAAAGLLVQTDLGRLECTPPSWVLNISLAGANNSVPTKGLAPCIIIVHVYTCNYSGAGKKNRRLLAFPGDVNGVIAPILHPCSVCARVVGSGRQTQANYVYDERISDGYIRGE